MSTRLRLFSLSLVSLLGAGASEVTPHTRYTVYDLGPVGPPPGQPFLIRNNGLVAGGAAAGEKVWRAVLWLRGLKIDIGRPGLGGPSSLANGVNERGQVVGQAESPEKEPNGQDFCGFGSRLVCLPFVWQNGLMSPLPPLKDRDGKPGANGIAISINNRGQVAGTYENSTRDTSCPPVNPALLQYQQFQFKPVVWEAGKIRELPTIGDDPDGIAFSINDLGQAVGSTGTCSAFQPDGNLTYLTGRHAVLWNNGVAQDLGNLGGVAMAGGNIAFSINNRGQVVGVSGGPTGLPRGFLWSAAAGIQDAGVVENDTGAVALGINDRGDAVGVSFDDEFNFRAFLRRDRGKPVDLNQLAPDSPLYLFHAVSINAHGEIVGMAVNENGDVHGYLAVPSTRNVAVLSTGERPAAQSRFGFAKEQLRRKLSRRPN